MTPDDVVTLGQQAMLVTLMAAAPMLLAGMVVGLIISIFQSVTQIQEITLTFVPKIMAVMLAFILTLPWISDMLLLYVRDLFMSIDGLVK